LNAVEHNQIAWTRERFRLPGHQSFETDYALWGFSTRPAGIRTATKCAFDPECFAEQVDHILKTYQEAKEPANWLLGPSTTPPDLKVYLRKQIRMMGPIYMPGMELDLSNWKSPLTGGVRINDWDWVVDCGHPTALWHPKASRADVTAMLLELELLGNTYPFIYEIDGVPASAMTLFVNDGIAGVYDVVTKPEYQNRGAASKVIASALRFAQELGCKVAVLQSYSKATELYRKLGFAETGTFTSMYYSRVRSAAHAMQKDGSLEANGRKSS
jgi:GNAT superfamily N-acetyltransferase